jgi:S1-C subfamily serine protease
MTMSALSDWQAARRALVEQACLCVVGIEHTRGRRCSGLVWNSDTVVTAAEAIQGAETVRVHATGDAVSGEIMAADLSVDVAVLKARTSAPGVSAAKPGALQPGDEVVIAGQKRGLPLVVWSHAQQIGPAWRSRSGGELPRLIRLAPELEPALEGGGVFDLDGHLCAMAVPGPRHQTLGIPAETIDEVVSTVLQHGRIPQPYLGVRLQPVYLDDQSREQLSRQGRTAVMVVGVEADSPAAAAGLLFGDLVLSIAGRPIDNAIDIRAALRPVPLGSPVNLGIYRAGAALDMTIVVRERSRD